jgi:hypothetical protein
MPPLIAPLYFSLAILISQIFKQADADHLEWKAILIVFINNFP